MSEVITNESAKGPITRRLSRRDAIRQRCINCRGWERGEVTLCDSNECSLHPYRMGTGKQNAVERGKAIKGYCQWCMVGDKKEVKLCPSVGCPLFPYRKSG